MSYLHITIVGYLGRDPEMRYTDSGTAVCSLNVATNKVYVKDGQQVKKVCWFRVSVFGKQAENVNNYLKKRSLVLVEGEMNAGEDGNPKVFARNDGSSGASYEVMAKVVRFLGGNSQSEDSTEPDEEIPF